MTTHQFPKRRSFYSQTDSELKKFMHEAPPGIVGMICGEQGRWSSYTFAMAHLQIPIGSQVFYDPGIDITKQCNRFVRAVRESDAQWLWLIGDDHTFNPLITFSLLWHQVDVVVPLVLQRSAPFYPVVYDGLNEEGHHAIKFNLPREGVHQVFAAGSAGMLIRKAVLDAVPEEPFQRWGHLQNEDLEFCRFVREAGFKIWCDVNEHMSHLGTMVVLPKWQEATGAWEVALEVGPQGPNGARSIIEYNRVSPGSPAMVPA